MYIVDVVLLSEEITLDHREPSQHVRYVVHPLTCDDRKTIINQIIVSW